MTDVNDIDKDHTNTPSSLFINNDDWEVTKEIYANSIVQDGIIDIEISLHDIVGIRRASAAAAAAAATTDGDDNVNNNNRRTNNDENDKEDGTNSMFEYCILSESFEPPVIRLSFQYTNSSDTDVDNNDDDYGDYDGVELDSVRIEIRSISQDLLASWPTKEHHYQHQEHQELEQSEQKEQILNIDKDIDENKNKNKNTNNKEENWLEWLTINSQELLHETKLSFSICDFIEHQALTYFNIVHKDENLGYSSILLDKSMTDFTMDVCDDYWTSVTRIPWNNSKVYTTKHIIQMNNTKSKSSKSNISKKGISKNHHHQEQVSNIDQYAIRTIQQQWKKWIQFTCPICFDTNNCYDGGIELPCRHMLCITCTEMYIQSKLSELQLYRRSPFICPIVSCKENMKIKSGIYPSTMITESNLKQIDEWKFNISYPKATILTVCPRKKCKSIDTIRRVSTEFIETMVFCNTCTKAFCELCLKMYNSIECKDTDHTYHFCDEATVLKLCRRYNHASDKIKCKADDKWHWLKEYASSREEDISAKLWVAEHASRCPTCRTAIERTEGCFHIHCTFCGTHFCYECGDEIHYPFYGTHHCWEEGRLFDEL